MIPSDVVEPSLSNRDFRFGGISRLYGRSALEKLSKSHGMVIGLGGVGSWAAEALVRSGLGKITLVDFDDICLSNTNRQIHALSETVGKAKIQVLAERFLLINPDLIIHLVDSPFDSTSYDQIFSHTPHVVIDAIDQARNKCLLISQCKKRNVPLVVTGAAGGRVNPNLIKTQDIAEVQQDALLARVRRILRQEYGFPRQNTKNGKGKKMGVLAVASSEPPRWPPTDSCQQSTLDGEVFASPPPKGPLDCQTGYGTASFVTGVFGFFSASAAVEMMIQSPKG